MRWTRSLIPTLRDDPADAEAISHKLMVRAGLVRQLAAGIYVYLPLGLRVIEKVNAIIRQEMNGIGGQEIEMPVLLPAEVQDVGVDVLGQRAGGHAEELGDLAAGERGLPRPQEELPGIVIEHHVSQWRLGQPAALAGLGELLVVAIGREVSCGVIELR